MDTEMDPQKLERSLSRTQRPARDEVPAANQVPDEYWDEIQK